MVTKYNTSDNPMSKYFSEVVSNRPAILANTQLNLSIL